MKTKIELIDRQQLEYVSFHIHELNEQIERLVQQIEQSTLFVLAKDPVKESMHKVFFKDILYIESVDKRTFLYTDEGVFLLKEKLFELEDLLKDFDYVRVSKSMILNLDKIQAIAATTSGRFRATLNNGESVMISRFYVKKLKEKLGIRRK
ncbi:LytTR family DNA-binding domain-containing protein [Bacillus sp. NPDC077027]|uniref:LytTR family DNA-binding domain-containing protein n=1 Tax=Bacillus sp. NPDC077027 TaxID=3390548 RepID=UPI003CFBE0E1